MSRAGWQLPGWRAWLCAAAILAGIGILVAAPPWLTLQQQVAAAVALGAVAFWGSGALPEPLTAFLFLALAATFVAPPEIVFAGFMSPAFWLVFGGVIVGMAVERTGLGGRIALRLSTLFGTRYAALVFGITFSCMLLAFPMPSALGRVVLVMPIVLALAEGSGFRAGSRGHTGLVLAGAFGTFMPGFGVMPANLINVVLVGAADSLLGVQLLYGEWLLRFFPVLGLAKSLVIALLVLALYRDVPDGEARPAERPAERPAPAPWRPEEGRLALFLLLAILGWASDMVHGLSPAWVAMLAACLCLMPRWGVLPPQEIGKVAIGPLLYVGGIMGLGAVVAGTGLGARLAELLLGAAGLEGGGGLAAFAGVTATALLLALGTTLPGVPAVMVPLVPEISAATGLQVEAVLDAVMLGASTPLLPYQAAPMVVALQLGGVSFAAGTRFALLLAAATICLLLPLEALWLLALDVL